MSYVLAVAVVAGLADVLGGYLMVMRPLPRRTIDQLVSLGAGFLLGGALFDLLPEAIESEPRAPLFIALGYGTLFVVGHLFAHHSHGHDHHEPKARLAWRGARGSAHRRELHPLVGEPHAPEPHISAGASWAALLGMILHTFFDGAAIAAAFRGNKKMGLLVFLAVFLHKLPEGFSMSAIMVSAARGRLTAFLAAVSLACSTLAGAIWVITATERSATGMFLALATGSFLYIGASDMIPATASKDRVNILLVILGGALVYLLSGGMHAVGVE